MVSNGSGKKKIVEAVGLTKVFSDFWFRAKARAVDGIDFSIDQNEIFGLLGPNGSGKSTTIKMILGLLRKSRGRLAVFGKEPSDVSIKSRIGYLPEETYMYRFLDARETLDYYGKLFGLERRIRKKRVDELLDMVGLSQVAHRKVGEYSKGMARRIGLAQALINDPDLLILDEPTSGLDPIGTRQVKGLLQELGRKGTTILLSSHLLSDVEDVCDRMVILYGGKIRAEGTADELLSDSNHTVIRVPHIDTKTIAAVEKTLQDSAGVSVEAVESPRQRLEDFFLDIVESARAEQIANAGAGKSGPTASFLSTAPEEGESLIETLSSEAVEAPAVIGVEKQSVAARKEVEAVAAKDEVLEGLLQNKEETTESAPKPAVDPIPETSADVDLGMIDGLLDESDGKGGKD
ncbi:MAG: ABC transporter ATP-binding protein [Planctomycetaceae bacterium]|nr:ABC transporter ATP-binding protein [Planctomycetaceae bacterium]|tara:strand:+ start:433 stop:1647 length:1215 start_codon:yes stop_codon:yes gene_type:complete